MPIDPTAGDSVRRALRRELRRRVLARRAALGQDEHRERSRAICGHLLENFPGLAFLRAGFYWPVNNEPDVRPALEAWRAAGHAAFAALLPVIVDAGAALAFRRWWPGMAMAADRHGIPTPESGDFVTPQALLVPLAAFDAAGFRLGYGGGYFDRTLAQFRPWMLAIGIGFELCRVDSIFPEAHDERLDAVVTESGVTFFGG
jgi:5,10-methenyltetrahydrofolate synthetase